MVDATMQFYELQSLQFNRKETISVIADPQGCIILRSKSSPKKKIALTDEKK
jgi:hypothetical protein